MIKSNWNDLEIRGEIVDAGFEGDPLIGVIKLDPYVEDLQILAPNGVDIFEYLDDAAVDECIDILLNEWRNVRA
jgi:hypothetical protein